MLVPKCFFFAIRK